MQAGDHNQTEGIPAGSAEVQGSCGVEGSGARHGRAVGADDGVTGQVAAAVHQEPAHHTEGGGGVQLTQ